MHDYIETAVKASSHTALIVKLLRTIVIDVNILKIWARCVYFVYIDQYTTEIFTSEVRSIKYFSMYVYVFTYLRMFYTSGFVSSSTVRSNFRFGPVAAQQYAHITTFNARF